MKCLIRERFKRVIDFNGQLINKVNGNYHKLTEDEIKFYNKLIFSNLKVLNNIANNMISKQTLIEEWFFAKLLFCFLKVIGIFQVLGNPF